MGKLFFITIQVYKFNLATTYFLDASSSNMLQNFDLYLTLGAPETQLPLDMHGVNWSVKLGLFSRRLNIEQKRPAKILKTY